MLDLTAPISREDLDRAYGQIAMVWNPDLFEGQPSLLAKAMAKSDALYAAYLWLHGLPDEGFPYCVENVAGMSAMGALHGGSQPRAGVPRAEVPRVEVPRGEVMRAEVPRGEVPLAEVPVFSSVAPALKEERAMRRVTKGAWGAEEKMDMLPPFMRRAGAWMIDVGVVAGVLLGGVFVKAFMQMSDMSDNRYAGPSEGLVATVVVLGTWLYHALLEWLPWQGSLGKKMLGLVVTDAEGGRAGLARLLARVAGMMASAFFPPLYLVSVWSPQRQCLHDMLSGCRVMWRLPAATAEAVAEAEELKSAQTLRQVGGGLAAMLLIGAVRKMIREPKPMPYSPPPYVVPAPKVGQ